VVITGTENAGSRRHYGKLVCPPIEMLDRVGFGVVGFTHGVFHSASCIQLQLTTLYPLEA
jgi:hypothetical protein